MGTSGRQAINVRVCTPALKMLTDNRHLSLYCQKYLTALWLHTLVYIVKYLKCTTIKAYLGFMHIKDAS